MVGMPVGRDPSRTVPVSVDLEQESFALLVKRINFDLQAFRITRQRQGSWESQVYHQKLMHKRQAWEHSLQSVQAFLHTNVKIILAEVADKTLLEMSAVREGLQVAQGLQADDVATRLQIYIEQIVDGESL